MFTRIIFGLVVVVLAVLALGSLWPFFASDQMSSVVDQLVEETEDILAETGGTLDEIQEMMDEEEGTLAQMEADIAAAQDDPYIWLEEVEGEEALAWVREQNEQTFAALQADPIYNDIYEASLEVYTSQERLALGEPRDGFLYNFWQDAEHVQGIWRRAPLEGYLAGMPEWETLIDLDALNLAEHGPDAEVNWVWDGVDCLAGSTRCLVSLSLGGLDAETVREFDMETREFVEGGFALAQAKQTAVWVNQDTLLVNTDRGEGTMTTSGYANTVVLWRRGESLDDAAEVFAGDLDDVGSFASSSNTPDGHRNMIVRAESFFEYHHYLVDADGTLTPMPAPFRADFKGFHAGQAIFGLNEDWTVDVGGTEQTFASGALVSYSIEDLQGDGTLSAVHLIYMPDARSALQGAAASGGALYVAVSENVVGNVYRATFDGKAWDLQPVALPDNGTVAIASTDDMEDRVFFSYENFLIPDSLYYAENGGTPVQVDSLPAWFDADGLVISQQEAVSADGTRVPYFLVHRADMPEDGTTPTILYGYGGFQISQQPFYSGNVGRLWLERGGAYALANIRGGGEFGPSWHQAALFENRQRAFDDFIAIAEHLIDTGVTSPEHLGIQGGSNGGLLVGAVLVQRPDLFGAVVCQVPLLDMLRYHLLLAGASWMGEYGNPDIPEQHEYIAAYSPYQNLDPEAEYPRVFMYTSTRDDRVHPGHARKFTARMLEQGHEVYYFERIEGGHSAGANLAQSAERVALEYTYFWEQLGGE